jgi:hypothetical protein
MMEAQKETVGFNPGGGDGSNQYKKATGIPETPVALPPKPTLAEAGIDKNLAKRARTAGSIHQRSVRRNYHGRQRLCGRNRTGSGWRWREFACPPMFDSRRQLGGSGGFRSALSAARQLGLAAFGFGRTAWCH